jgi:hypothetical protein
MKICVNGYHAMSVKIMNHTCNIDRAMERVIAIAGTTSRTTSTTERFSLNYSRRPENFNVTICTMHNLMPGISFALRRFLIMLIIWLSIVCVHFSYLSVIGY